MPQAWRIIKEKYQTDAFSGEGAFRHGGRWNPPGVRVVYVAGNLSGAILEILVHSDRRLLKHYAALRVEIPEQLISSVMVDDLPTNWRESPAPPALREIGQRWFSEGHKAVLQVPSAVVPQELNYLINPTHADFRLISVDAPIRYQTDQRLN